MPLLVTKQVEENEEKDVQCHGCARPLAVAGRGASRAAVGVLGEFAEFTVGSDKASQPAAERPMMCLQEHEADPAADESDGASR